MSAAATAEIRRGMFSRPLSGGIPKESSDSRRRPGNTGGHRSAPTAERCEERARPRALAKAKISGDATRGRPEHDTRHVLPVVGHE